MSRFDWLIAVICACDVTFSRVAYAAKLLHVIRDCATIVCYFYGIHSRLAILKTSQETRKNVRSFFTKLDITITYYSSAILRVQSLCNESLLRVSLRFLHLPTAYVIPLFSQWYELSAEMTFYRKCTLCRCRIKFNVSVEILPFSWTILQVGERLKTREYNWGY